MADLQLHLEPKARPCPLMEPKDRDRTSQKQRVPRPGRSGVDTLYHKWPSSQVLQLKVVPQHFHILVPQALKNSPEPWAGEFQLLSIHFLFSWVAPCVNKTASLSTRQLSLFSVWLCW